MRYVVPSIIVLLLQPSCGPLPPPHPCRQVPCISSDKAFSATFPTRPPKGAKQPWQLVWIPTIKDISGTTVFEDENSNLSGYHKSYWEWDSENRLWVYNSDDANVYVYFSVDDEWQKLKHDLKSKKYSPPTELAKVIFRFRN